jgi:polysaccharide pyruvyl transferase WcaK-like protein
VVTAGETIRQLILQSHRQKLNRSLILRETVSVGFLSFLGCKSV